MSFEGYTLLQSHVCDQGPVHEGGVVVPLCDSDVVVWEGNPSTSKQWRLWEQHTMLLHSTIVLLMAIDLFTTMIAPETGLSGI